MLSNERILSHIAGYPNTGANLENISGPTLVRVYRFAASWYARTQLLNELWPYDAGLIKIIADELTRRHITIPEGDFTHEE